jgi:hypothetical protein
VVREGGKKVGERERKKGKEGEKSQGPNISFKGTPPPMTYFSNKALHPKGSTI